MPAREAIAEAFRAVSADVETRRRSARASGSAPRTSGTTSSTAGCRRAASRATAAGAAFLFEVNPQIMPAGIENELFQLRVSGYLPVMAHPERYTAVQRDVTLAERLGRHAVHDDRSRRRSTARTAGRR